MPTLSVKVRKQAAWFGSGYYGVSKNDKNKHIVFLACEKELELAKTRAEQMHLDTVFLVKEEDVAEYEKAFSNYKEILKNSKLEK